MTLPLFYAIYLIEAGLFFTIVPWTTIWTLNPLLHGNLAVGAVADNPFFRGFVTGIGILHLLLGMRELFDLLAARRERRSS